MFVPSTKHILTRSLFLKPTSTSSLTAIALCLALVAACDRSPHELTLVTPNEPVDRSVAEDIAELIDDEATVRIGLSESPTSETAALEMLLSGDADLALVSNNLPFHGDLEDNFLLVHLLNIQ